MALRKMELTVGGTPIGTAQTWSYPSDDSKRYSIPTYSMQLAGTDGKGAPVIRTFEVIRFGVHRKSPTDRTTVVGLADPQRYTIQAWLPSYTVHSARSIEKGAWKVFANYLIHDGPDDPRNEVYATAGCIEICGGPQGFDRFNDMVIALSGSTKPTRGEQLDQIGKSGIMRINYVKAARPPLVEWTGP
jgi:hypothetical protein